MLFPVLALMDRLPLGKQRNLNTSSCLCAPPFVRGPLLGRVGQPHGETAGGSGRVPASTPAGVPFGGAVYAIGICWGSGSFRGYEVLTLLLGNLGQ